jgi:hypothetical protein
MPDGLAALQRWMIGALQDGTVSAVEDVLVPSPTMSAADGLEVYRRGFRLRLLECLREMHPGLRHLAGDDLFDAFALDYLAFHPPAGYSLSRLGAGFADHLDETCPDADRGPWTDLVVDVVRFEQAFLDVYDGPPGVRVLRSRFPVGDYVCAVRRGEEPPMPAPAPAYEALVRRDYVVERVPLTARSCPVLEALLAGAGPAEAAWAGGVTESEVLGWTAAWAERGLLAPRKEATCC